VNPYDSQNVPLVPLVGIDGCPHGWVAATWHTESDQYAITLHSSFAELLAALPRAACYAIDIPIGLPDSSPRDADRSARRFIGPRGSSVFPTPVRSAVALDTYAEASAQSFKVSGKKIGKQTFNIMPKIREVDEALQRDPALRTRVVEIHPEVSFTCLNHGVPMSHPKRTEAGRVERLALLSPKAQQAYQTAMEQLRRNDVASDDIIDALAAVWSAQRVVSGTAQHFPGGPPISDATGLLMRIVA
jgi:predicted RNase H-like nuclease